MFFINTINSRRCLLIFTLNFLYTTMIKDTKYKRRICYEIPLSLGLVHRILFPFAGSVLQTYSCSLSPLFPTFVLGWGRRWFTSNSLSFLSYSSWISPIPFPGVDVHFSFSWLNPWFPFRSFCLNQFLLYSLSSKISFVSKVPEGRGRSLTYPQEMVTRTVNYSSTYIALKGFGNGEQDVHFLLS